MAVKSLLAAVSCAIMAACAVGPAYKRPPVTLQNAWTTNAPGGDRYG